MRKRSMNASIRAAALSSRESTNSRAGTRPLDSPTYSIVNSPLMSSLASPRCYYRIIAIWESMAGQTLIAYRKCSLALSILHNNVTCLAFVSSHQTSIWMPLILKPLACNIILANRSRCWTEWTENQIRASFRNGCKCLIQESIGIARHIEMQDLTPIVADDEKAVQNTKSERWDGEKVHRSNGCFRQLDLAPFDLLFWPHLLVNPLSAPGRSEALRRP